MKTITLSLATLSACLATLTSASTLFSGDFLLSNVVVDAPFQAYPNSTQSSIIYFDFTDQDTLYLPCTHCSITWPVGITPENGTAMCLNDTFAVNVPDATYWGIQNFSLELSHTYIDETIGEFPYNILTKFGTLNLTYPETVDYECELERGHCESVDGASFLAMVTSAIS